jgi:integrase
MTYGRGFSLRKTSITMFFMLEGRRCRPTLVTNGVPMKPTPGNIRYAERLAAEIKEKIRLGTFSYSEYFPADGNSGEALTVGRQLDTWLGTQRIEQSTLATYSTAVRFWKAAVVDGLALGDRPVRGIKHSDLLLALATKPGLNGKTINNYVSCARQAFELAVEDGVLKKNPAEKIPRAAWQKEPPDPFSVDEVGLIIGYMLKHYPEPIANLTQWRFYCGARPSEAAGLQWPSVDLQAGYVRIHEAIVSGKVKAKTKTGVVRDILLNTMSREAILRQAKHTRMAGAHVWMDPRYGLPWLDEHAFRRVFWMPTLKALGIRYRAPNQSRHTFASMMLMAGRTSAWCAGQMGHSIEVFHRTYARWLKGDQDAREMAGFEAWLKSNNPGKKEVI